MFQKAYFYPLFAILFWAGNVVVSKMASHAISPVAITFYRLVLALAGLEQSTHHQAVLETVGIGWFSVRVSIPVLVLSGSIHHHSHQYGDCHRTDSFAYDDFK